MFSLRRGQSSYTPCCTGSSHGVRLSNLTLETSADHILDGPQVRHRVVIIQRIGSATVYHWHFVEFLLFLLEEILPIHLCCFIDILSAISHYLLLFHSVSTPICFCSSLVSVFLCFVIVLLLIRCHVTVLFVLSHSIKDYLLTYLLITYSFKLSVHRTILAIIKYAEDTNTHESKTPRPSGTNRS